MRGAVAVTTACLVATLVGPAAQASAGGPPTARAAATPAQRAAERLFGRAAERVFGRPPCEARPGGAVIDATPTTDAQLPPAFAASFSLLRRAPTEAELAVAERVPPSRVAIEETFRRGTRIVRSDGVTVEVRIHSRATLPGVSATAARCVARVRSEVRRLGRSQRRAVVRRALALAPPVRPRPERTGSGATLVVRRGSAMRVASAVVRPEALSRRGLLAAVPDGAFSLVAALAPDGVSTVNLKYPSTKLTVTSTVSENVATVLVPRPLRQAMPRVVVWRDPRDRVVRTIRW